MYYPAMFCMTLKPCLMNCRGKKITDIAWFIYLMTGFLLLIAAGELSPTVSQLLSYKAPLLQMTVSSESKSLLLHSSCIWPILLWLLVC